MKMDSSSSTSSSEAGAITAASGSAAPLPMAGVALESKVRLGVSIGLMR
jgi:hypothetical protein